MVLLNFWATWCAPCLAEFQEFITINRMYRHRDFEQALTIAATVITANQPKWVTVDAGLKAHDGSAALSSSRA